MPELPEIQTIVGQLAPLLPGHIFMEVEVRRRDVVHGPEAGFRQELEGREVVDVGRRGKNILIHLSSGSSLVVNLGMTGQLLLFPEGKGGDQPPHTAILFHLDPEGTLYYADVRRFGLLRLYDPEEWQRESARLGPEPLDRGLTVEEFHQRITSSRSPVRSWLLDQRKVAGIGNIYATEALFRSGIHPRRRASSLAPGETQLLLSAIRQVLQEAIKAQGTTLRDYRTASGERGSYGSALLVYGREGESCPTCKTPVERIVFGNRSAFFCPCCQPEPT